MNNNIIHKRLLLFILVLLSLSKVFTITAFAKQLSILFTAVENKALVLDLVKIRTDPTHQDIAVYNDTIFEFGSGTARVNNTLFSIKNGHGNNCNFGDILHDGDKYPYLYCAPWNEKDNHIYVNQITEHGALLIKTITYEELDNGYLNAVVDESNNRVYIFLADNPYSGNIRFLVGDLDGNILREKKLASTIPVIQGMTMRNNTIYIVSGFSDQSYRNTLYTFDTYGNFRSKSEFIMPDIEMEGISIDKKTNELYIANIKKIYKYSKIQKVSINSASASNSITLSYNGKAQKPEPEVILDGRKRLLNSVDYTVSYKDNINAGTATMTISGKGRFSGEISKPFTINPCNISNAIIDSVPVQRYTSQPICPKLQIRMNGKSLGFDKDYTIRYSDNIAVGTALMTIMGKGNFSGSINKTFTINKESIKKAVVDSIPKQNYTNKHVCPKPIVRMNGKLLNLNTDYTLKYNNNIKSGTASITIIGKGNYCDSIKKKFKIVVPKIKLNVKGTVPLRVNKRYKNIIIISGITSKDKVSFVRTDNRELLEAYWKKGILTLKTRKMTGCTALTIKLASGLTKKIKIKIQKNEIKTKKIIIKAKKIKLKKGERARIDTELYPVSSSQKITYKSSSDKVARVSSKGTIIAKRKGKAVIIVKSGRIKTKVTVIVK